MNDQTRRIQTKGTSARTNNTRVIRSQPSTLFVRSEIINLSLYAFFLGKIRVEGCQGLAQEGQPPLPMDGPIETVEELLKSPKKQDRPALNSPVKTFVQQQLSPLFQVA
jgi:hypothetical protein